MLALHRSVVLTVLTALVGGLLVAVLGAPAQAAWVTPSPGVTVNNPLGSKRNQQAINWKVQRSIRSVPKGHRIRVASWNIRNDGFINALVNAHRRGVSVRVVLDRGNANPRNVNQGVDRLQRALKGARNGRRKPAMRSGVRRCVRSCRGRYGIPHTKFFAFSKVANARWVVMNGSWNATDLASTGQWNDLYTVTRRRGLFQEYERTFNQMYRDRRVKQGFRVRAFGNVVNLMLPFSGKGTYGDPTMRELNAVRCRGARNTGSGRTSIKVAMTSWHGNRGIRIARKVRKLYAAGCQVKIVYGVMGNEILRIMRHGRRGRIPFRQVAQDFNRDGVYDRYLHTKVLTIQGRYRNNRRAWVTVNGSLNWTPVPLTSDEAMMRISSRGVNRRYQRFIDRWYRDTPARQYRSARVNGRSAFTAPVPQDVPLGRTVDGVDPYATFQEH